MPTDLTGTISTKKFSEAAGEVLKFLNQTLGFNLWVLTRMNGDEYIVLQSEDQGYDVPAGSVFKWSDTFCSRMVAGKGPNFAANIHDVTEYTNAPFFKMADVGSYMGVPVCYADGSVFGTLCAIHPTVREESLSTQLPMVQTFATLLSNLLTAEMQSVEDQRRVEHAEAEVLRDDVVIELYNRRGWEKLAKAEYERSRTIGHKMAVLSIDLDNLKTLNDTQGHAKGTEYIQKAGQAIKSCLREQDIGARVGGDEYLILLAESDEAYAAEFLKKLKAVLMTQQVAASIGMAHYNHSETLAELTDRADKLMYDDKRARKSGTTR